MPAVVLGAAISGAATLVAGNQASNATENAAATAAGVQREGLAQSERLSRPYRQFGEGLLPQLQRLLTPGADATALLRSMPGYQFQQDEGNRSTINAATASGMNLSGNTLRSLSEFNQGLADTTYQQNVDNLFRGAGMGQAAAAGQAQAAQGTAANLANIATGAGQDQANIAIGQGASLAGIAGNAINSYTTQQTLAALNNPGGGAPVTLPPGTIGPPGP